jgi:Ricin-type beta-trefoil lectin domain
MYVHKRKRTSCRRLKVALLAAMASGSMALLGSSPAFAAVLSFGNFPGNVFGGNLCADVQAGTLANGTPVDAFSCTAAPNQQFEFNGLTIYALGGQKCLDIAIPDNQTPTPGTLVDIYECNGGNHQKWIYMNGEIINISKLCLEGSTGANGAQLVVDTCDVTNPNQQWQIK